MKNEKIEKRNAEKMKEGKMKTSASETMNAEGTAEMLRAVADENRLRILHLLMQRDELCVCDIERVLDMTQTKVSRHLGTLRHARLVTARREGRWMYYALRRDDQFTVDLLALLGTRFAEGAQYRQDLHILDNNADLVCEIQTELR